MLQDTSRINMHPLLKNIQMEMSGKKTVSELVRKTDLSKNHFKKWMKSANSSTYAGFVAAQEIVRHRKPFTDGEYIKESFIQFAEHLFTDSKKKSEIVQTIRDKTTKTVKGRTIKMAEDITRQQTKDINSAVAYSIACDESTDKGNIEQIALFCCFVNSAGPQEEMIELIPLKGQTRGEDSCEAVLNCFRDKEINTTHPVTVATKHQVCPISRATRALWLYCRSRWTENC